AIPPPSTAITRRCTSRWSGKYPGWSPSRPATAPPSTSPSPPTTGSRSSTSLPRRTSGPPSARPKWARPSRTFPTSPPVASPCSARRSPTSSPRVSSFSRTGAADTRPRKGYLGPGARLRRAADLQRAAHRLREGAGDHEAEARARLRRAFGAQPVERDEQPAHHLRRDPRAGVTDRHRHRGRDATRPRSGSPRAGWPDLDPTARVVVADAVGDQVDQHLAEPP